MSDIVIIILHGWRVKAVRYDDLKKLLEQKGFRVFVPEFPGFDGGKIPDEGYTLLDYVSFLDNFISSYKLSSVVVIGHSFGGRVVVKYLDVYKKNKLIKAIVLTGVPLVKESLSLRKLFSLNIVSYIKFIETFFPLKTRIYLREKLRFIIYRMIGEYDYYKAGNLQKTLQNILSDDPEKYLSHIKVPTLIIWGENDRITPVSIARRIHDIIAQSKLVIEPFATHKIPFEQPKIFAESVNFFIENFHG